MPEEKKKVWQDKSSREGQIYKKKMEKYEKTNSYAEFMKLKAQDDLMKIKKKKAPKDPNRPKKPLSAFMFFVQDFRNQHQNLKITEASKAAAVVWKELGDKRKNKYIEKAAVAKAEYQKLQGEYVKSDDYLEFQEELKTFKTKKDAKIKRIKKLQQ